MEMTGQAKAHTARVTLPSPPELPEVAKEDRNSVEGILTVLWALQDCGQTPISWNVSTKEYGYIITVSFGQHFSLSLVDLQLAKEVSPLRVENIFIRNAVNADVNGVRVGCTVVVKLLNTQQKIMVTEADVVRIKKRKKGWFQSESC